MGSHTVQDTVTLVTSASTTMLVTGTLSDIKSSSETRSEESTTTITDTRMSSTRTRQVFNSIDAIVVESLVSLRLGGTQWESALAKNEKQVLKEIQQSVAERFGLPSDFVIVSNPRIGSLIVDITIRRNGTYAMSDVVIQEVLSTGDVNLTTVQYLYHNLTNTTEAVEVVGFTVIKEAVSAADLSGRTSGVCDSNVCPVAAGVGGGIGGLLMIGIIIFCCVRWRKKDAARKTGNLFESHHPEVDEASSACPPAGATPYLNGVRMDQDAARQWWFGTVEPNNKTVVPPTFANATTCPIDHLGSPIPIFSVDGADDSEDDFSDIFSMNDPFACTATTNGLVRPRSSKNDKCSSNSSSSSIVVNEHAAEDDIWWKQLTTEGNSSSSSESTESGACEQQGTNNKDNRMSRNTGVEYSPREPVEVARTAHEPFHGPLEARKPQFRVKELVAQLEATAHVKIQPSCVSTPANRMFAEQVTRGAVAVPQHNRDDGGTMAARPCMPPSRLWGNQRSNEPMEPMPPRANSPCGSLVPKQPLTREHSAASDDNAAFGIAESSDDSDDDTTEASWGSGPPERDPFEDFLSHLPISPSLPPQPRPTHTVVFVRPEKDEPHEEASEEGSTLHSVVDVPGTPLDELESQLRRLAASSDPWSNSSFYSEGDGPIK